MADKKNTELELKLSLLDPGCSTDLLENLQLPAIINAGQPITEHLEAWYYDTGDQLLQKAGIAYRVRFEDGQWLATVKAGDKSAGGLHERKEWNIPADGPLPTLAHLKQTAAGTLLDGLADTALVPLFCTTFDRRKIKLETDDGSVIELAVDLGAVIAGEISEQIAELELELISGEPAAILKAGAQLAEIIPLTVEPRSKYYRGLRLAGLTGGPPPAAAITVDAGSNAVTLCRRLIINQINRVFSAQAALILDAGGHETLHQLRIQIRQLRSFLSFARPLIAEETYNNWQNRLRDWLRSMAGIRELDVISETWQEITAQSGLALNPPPWLAMMLQEERAKQALAVTAAAAKGQHTSLLLGLWSWLIGPAFTNDRKITGADFLTERLADWTEEMREIAKKLVPGDYAALHRLRVIGKKLRYTLAGVPLKDKKTRLLLARLRRLQDTLGIIRDAKTTAEYLDGWMQNHASRVLFRDAGLLLGWTAKSDLDARDNLERNWRRFRRAARRWVSARQK